MKKVPFLFLFLCGLLFSCSSDSEVTPTIDPPQEEMGIESIQLEKDIQITPTGGAASEAQGGQGIELSYDGNTDPATHYHSRWGNGTILPVTLEYFFEGNKEAMDYIVYHTRNGNGNFGEFDLYIATGNTPEYTLYGSYDFNMQNAPSRIALKDSPKGITKVKFVVKTGLGGFVSCSEMQFFRKNTEKKLDRQLLAVFSDLTCSTLKPNVSEEAINDLPGYFKQLATLIQKNSYSQYEKEFRIQTYQPYSHPEEWAEKLMTKKYSYLNNPTGISVKRGDEILLLVGDTHGHTISVQNVGEETIQDSNGSYVQTAASGDSYFLQEGVNKIIVNQTGMLFIVYHTDLSAADALPIKIHIPAQCGEVAGYFDLERHQTNNKYVELIGQSDYKYFCVKGERIIFYFHRDKMKAAVPTDILSAIHLWDDIVGWQHELMGIEDVYPSQMNNRLFAISPEGSYMWASDYRVAFVYTYLDNILLRDNVMAAKDNAWGPAHEIGHIHQPAINWPSCTESSNNLFSNYILYKLGKYCSRGETLDRLATYRFVNGDAWYNMGDATHQNESTEIHMRMNWQLWNYYHRCGYMTDFWPKMFKALREDRIVESDPGAGQLHFAKMACKVANENLTDFFEMWGFFEPVDNVTYSQYGTWNYNVTPSMIAEAKAYMAQYPKPKHAFYFLEDRKEGDVGLDVEPGDVGYYEQFKKNQKITKTVAYSRNGQNISITNGDEAVAFELYLNGKLIYFSNTFNFSVPSSIPLNDNVKVCAVQADGMRIEL
ncbi:MAG: M60 family metallopeptidase [Bacteroides sp.]|nr:M60 family metallopeptidase [Bacteroides sp.]